jgi:hypothetical protein
MQPNTANLIALKERIRSLAAYSRKLRQHATRSLGEAEKNRIRARLIAAKMYSAKEIERIIARGRVFNPVEGFALVLALLGAQGNSDSEELVRAPAHYIMRHLLFKEAKPVPTEETCLGYAAEHAAAYAALDERRADLSIELRWLHLAYGFLRGTPYHAMERKTYKAPPWHVSNRRRDFIRKAIKSGDSVIDLAEEFLNTVNFYSDDTPQERMQRYAQWLDKAGAWRHPHYREPPVPTATMSEAKFAETASHGV